MDNPEINKFIVYSVCRNTSEGCVHIEHFSYREEADKFCDIWHEAYPGSDLIVQRNIVYLKAEHPHLGRSFRLKNEFNNK